jgi:hypothetical protein
MGCAEQVSVRLDVIAANNMLNRGCSPYVRNMDRGLPRTTRSNRPYFRPFTGLIAGSGTA